MYDLKSLTVLIKKSHKFLDSSYMSTKYTPV